MATVRVIELQNSKNAIVVPKVLKKATFGTTIDTFYVFPIVFPLFSIIFAEDLLHSAI